MQDFVSISLVYLGIYALAAWSLNLQFGYAGIINFGWIVFQSIGAYFAAVTSLGPVTRWRSTGPSLSAHAASWRRTSVVPSSQRSPPTSMPMSR